ncbi:P-loop NTPase [bacterium]|nr:P-loop NTPase [bacterium]
MKEITVISGKGGTGKTTVTAALASLAEKAVMCDCDVDAADMHLIFPPQIIEKNIFVGAQEITIDADTCIHCGLCISHCRFDALFSSESGTIEVDEYACEGCRLCERICPTEAITSAPSLKNEWFVSKTRMGYMVHAKMAPGEENSGKLVSVVRQKTKELGKIEHLNYIINDGPPGIGCAAIASLTGADKALLVIEPTVSGFHDAKRLFELIEQFKIEAFVVINKYDIHLENTIKIEHYFENKNAPVLAKIPFDKNVVEAMVEGKTMIEYQPQSVFSKEIEKVWETLKK